MCIRHIGGAETPVDAFASRRRRTFPAHFVRPGNTSTLAFERVRPEDVDLEAMTADAWIAYVDPPSRRLSRNAIVVAVRLERPVG